MVDIQKLLLLQWVEGVGLFYDDHDARLDDPATRVTISKTLHSIHLLLSKGSDIQQIYGVKIADSAQRLLALVLAISRSRMKSFLRLFEELKIGVGKRQKETSVTKKFFWVIRDKDKFETLIGQLTALVSGLNSVIPPADGLLEKMMRSDLTGVQDVQQSRIIWQATKGSATPIAGFAEDTMIRLCEKLVPEKLVPRH